MSVRRLLDNSDWDDWDNNDEVAEAAGKAVSIGVGIIIAIVVCIIVVVIVSVIICVYCNNVPVRTGATVPPPQPYAPYPQGYPPVTGAPTPPGPAQAYPPVSAGGFVKPGTGVMAPPPYSPQSGPVAYNDTQKASAPPME